MKAEFKPRIDRQNRTRLETVIPLKTPFIINIDPSDVCNFQCKFCPTGDRELMKKTQNRGHGLIEFDLYKKIVDDICEFDEKIKVLRLYKDGEPLINPNFPKMVDYAKKSGCCDRVDTTTNASLLTHELSDRIIESGLDRINISIEGVNAEQYKEFSKYNIVYDKLVDNIRYFYEQKKKTEMIVKINGDILTENEKQQFLDTFGDITDGIYIESIMDCWPTFEQLKVEVNKDRGIYGQNIEEVMVCPYVFYSMAVNSDGTVSLCFLDWSRNLIIGDCKREHIVDIWNGDNLKKYRKMFLHGERNNHPICANCGQLSQGEPDNIDDYREQILTKI